MSDSARRTAMIDSQLRTNDITDPRLVKAVGEVARERFVPATLSAVAYMEATVPLSGGRVLLDARSFGKLAQLAAIQPTDQVLDVACGTGYSTVVLAHLAAHVTGLEEDMALAQTASKNLADLHIKNAQVLHGELAKGWPGNGPYDVIFMNGAVAVTPVSLLAQLKDGGRLVCVMREGAAGHGYLFVKHDSAISERSAFDAQLPVLPGFQKEFGFVF